MMDPPSIQPTGLQGHRSNCGVGVLMDLSGGRSHDLVEDGLTALEHLDHRGARGAEANTGDGAGIMLQLPHAFFADEVDGLGDPGAYAVGQLFLPADDEAATDLRTHLESVVEERNWTVIGWREVPTDSDDLGDGALADEPAVWQVFLEPPAPDADLDAETYVLRRAIESAVEASDLPGAERFYVCSLDHKTIVYKGLLTNAQVRTYYPDLTDDRVQSGIVMVHSRFSTNTLGAWHLAHPYRNVIHNGEFNTIQGNVNWLRAREGDLASDQFGDDIDTITPVTDPDQSDTAIVDDALGLLTAAGRSPPHALRMLVPEAWHGDDTMADARRTWYRYHASLVEPWDGPALVAFCDGDSVTAILDRNGLRPCRYTVTTDDRLIMASETGVLDTDPEDIERRGRLGPGELFHASPERGIVDDETLFDELTEDRYREWLAANQRHVDELEAVEADPGPLEDLTAEQRTFGYTREHLDRLVEPMATEGSDPVGAMGNDTPLSVLSDRNKTLFTYFKQLFAQVSNPPIDYKREALVTSLRNVVGRQRNLLSETPDHCRQLVLDSPLVTREELATIAALEEPGAGTTRVDMTYPTDGALEDAIERLRSDVRAAIDDGHEIVVMSDRAAGPDRLPIPSLLATGAVHHDLVRNNLRTRAGLVLESGGPCAVHHVATLVGYGADAICPYLAYESIDELAATQLELDRDIALEQYRTAIDDGLQKVMSKMGISTLESYKGAQIFEAVGLDSSLVEAYFTGTTNRTEGVGLDELEADLRERHELAYGDRPVDDLDQGGELYWRRNGEYHQWNPHTIGKLQYATRNGGYEAYKEFAAMVNDQNEQLQTLRGLLAFDAERRDPIPLEEVEPVEDIVTRFFTASMSFGSLSKEAHETLAIAMNRLGGTACTGEGGEQRDRVGTERECTNKQVASGRFGVTSAYLSDAEHLEIKMAQGSKPGEGGHLPGEKVNETIAEVRHTTPGVSLISPPPHHDIYSIEDLAQLIHDLKCAGPDADVHVKLVSEAGVGIIAAGVAKGKADAVLISGQSGGTGASPKTSIKSAGLPWELGIAEAQQVLQTNELRSRIRVRVDGGFKTGRDVAVAALLGAEEFGFGTGPLVTCGCIMLRKCHCNTCSVGIATQDPELREKFPGKPEYVVRYMRYIAQELREIMADLGLRTVDEMVGRSDLLAPKDVDHPKASGMDLSSLLEPVASSDPPRQVREQDHGLADALDQDLLEEIGSAIRTGDLVAIDRAITNRDRTVGTMLSSAVSSHHGETGLPDETITLRFQGTGGQSLGAFLTRGVTIDLEGAANDYLGKGLSGGKIVVRTPDRAGYEPAENVVVGNVALYGGTSGECYVNGAAGERFAVRNSGVKTVVEGVGDHGCEYMTGGVVAVLGETGRNFGAGMSGGEAYVYDPDDHFPDRVNRGMVRLEHDLDERDERMLKRMVENHVRYTASERARELLADWERTLESFVKVVPETFAAIVEERLAEGEDPRAAPPPRPSRARTALGGDA